MPYVVEITEDNEDVIDTVIANIYGEIGIKLSKRDLVPLVFGDPREITDIVLRQIRSRIK